MLTAQIFEKVTVTKTSTISSSNNPPLRFNTEEQLVHLFEAIVGHKIQKYSSGLLTEFECGDGVADIVLYEIHKGWKNRQHLGELSPRWVYSLRSLPYRKYFTTSEFAALSMSTRNTAVTILNKFVEHGFCKRKNTTGFWIKTIQPRQIVKNIYAVEAKLRHWKRALVQAVRYRDYATQSWVLLDEYSIKPALDNLDQFIRLNIGLVALSTEGSIITYLTPSPLPPKSPARFWQANAEIAHRLLSHF